MWFLRDRRVDDILIRLENLERNSPKQKPGHSGGEGGEGGDESECKECAEIEMWKAKYNEVLKKYTDLAEDKLPLDKLEIPQSFISRKAIERFVDERMKDPNLNIYMLPDAIERPMLINSFHMSLSMLEKLTDVFNFEYLGHRIHVAIEPIIEERETSRDIETNEDKTKNISNNE